MSDHSKPATGEMISHQFGKIEADDLRWDMFPHLLEVKDFIQRGLQTNELQAANASEMLTHPWLKGVEIPEYQMSRKTTLAQLLYMVKCGLRIQ